MDKQIAQRLRRLNTDFYQANAASFSDTRQGGWPGWERLLEELSSHGVSWSVVSDDANAMFNLETVTLLDVACGNCRFERFLGTQLPGVEFAFHAMDNCEALAARAQSDVAAFHQRDVVGGLIAGDNVFRGLPLFDCIVSFGFMHHIPDIDARGLFVKQALDCLLPGGFIVLSFWRFADVESLCEKAEMTTTAALRHLGIDDSALDDGDYLLGWQDTVDSYRYCHSFSDEEISQLVQAVLDEADVVSRFRADGRTGGLNEYLILQRR